MAGVTPVIDDSLLVKSILGERFILYRAVHDDREAMTRQALKNTGKEKEMRSELNKVVKDFLSQFQKVDNLPDCPEEIEEKMIYLADITARIRSSVPREGTGNKDIKYVPDPELPPRLAKQFKLLACGLALVRDRAQVTEDEYCVLRKIALDTAPRHRTMVLKALLNAEYWLKTREVADKIRYPSTTTKIILEDLYVLKIAERRFVDSKDESDTSQKISYEWSINTEFWETVSKVGFALDEL